jgi:hypothetical protein
MIQFRKSSIFNKLEAVRDLKVDEVNHWLDERIGDIRIISADNEIRGLERIDEGKEEYIQQYAGTIKEARELLRRYLKNYSTFHKIFIISPHTERILISTHEIDEGESRSNDPYLTGALQNRGLFIKDIYFSKVENMPSMTFSVPIFSISDSNDIIGILVIKINLKTSLYDLHLQHIGMENTGETLIVNRDAIVLNELRWYQSAPLNLKINTQDVLDATRGNTGIMETTDYREKMVLSAYTRVPRTGWGLLVKQDLEEVYAPIYKFRNWTLNLGIITRHCIKEVK